MCRWRRSNSHSDRTRNCIQSTLRRSRFGRRDRPGRLCRPRRMPTAGHRIGRYRRRSSRLDTSCYRRCTCHSSNADQRRKRARCRTGMRRRRIDRPASRSRPCNWRRWCHKLPSMQHCKPRWRSSHLGTRCCCRRSYHPRSACRRRMPRPSRTYMRRHCCICRRGWRCKRRSWPRGRHTCSAQAWCSCCHYSSRSRRTGHRTGMHHRRSVDQHRMGRQRRSYTRRRRSCRRARGRRRHTPRRCCRTRTATENCKSSRCNSRYYTWRCSQSRFLQHKAGRLDRSRSRGRRCHRRPGHCRPSTRRSSNTRSRTTPHRRCTFRRGSADRPHIRRWRRIGSRWHRTCRRSARRSVGTSRRPCRSQPATGRCSRWRRSSRLDSWCRRRRRRCWSSADGRHRRARRHIDICRRRCRNRHGWDRRPHTCRRPRRNCRASAPHSARRSSSRWGRWRRRRRRRRPYNSGRLRRADCCRTRRCRRWSSCRRAAGRSSRRPRRASSSSTWTSRGRRCRRSNLGSW